MACGWLSPAPGTVKLASGLIGTKEDTSQTGGDDGGWSREATVSLGPWTAAPPAHAAQHPATRQRGTQRGLRLWPALPDQRFPVPWKWTREPTRGWTEPVRDLSQTRSARAPHPQETHPTRPSWQLPRKGPGRGIRKQHRSVCEAAAQGLRQ